MTTQIDESYVKMPESEIAQFFVGRKILVTVGLGFMGKLLIEKLLRCCPQVATLYVLVRRKDGKCPRERVRELYEIPLYKRLRREQPDFLNKLTVIEGNLDSMDLDLSLENRKKLLDTNIIFHGTSTIRSNQKLRTMTNVNVQSTKQLLLLAKEMPDLKVFVHLSTVFAQSPLLSIEEIHYPPPMETDKLLWLMDALDDRKLEKIAPTLIGEWPDTFTYTKAIAEDTVLRYGKGMPVCIVRPSIVTPTWNEPIMGWTDSVYGPVGLLVGSSLGLLRTIHCHTNKRPDFVPGDYVTSSLIAAAWQTSTRHTKKLFKVDVETGIVPDKEKVPVYNYVSSNQSPITWNTFRKHVRAHGSKVPGVKDIRPQCMFWNSRAWMHTIFMWLFHILPGLVMDALMVLVGRATRYGEVYGLIYNHLEAASYFTTRQWHYQSDAMVKLWKEMNAMDRKLFAFDMSKFDWDKYVRRMIRGDFVKTFVNQMPWHAYVVHALSEHAER